MFKHESHSAEEAEEIVNWDFSAGLNLEDSKFELGKYKLVLADDYFTASIWEVLTDAVMFYAFVGMLFALRWRQRKNPYSRENRRNPNCRQK